MASHKLSEENSGLSAKKELERTKTRGFEIVILGEPVAKGRPRATINKRTGRVFVYIEEMGCQS